MKPNDKNTVTWRQQASDIERQINETTAELHRLRAERSRIYAARLAELKEASGVPTSVLCKEWLDGRLSQATLAHKIAGRQPALQRDVELLEDALRRHGIALNED